MAAETEAELLLRTGQLYVRRGGFRARGSGELVFVGVKHGGVSVYVGDDRHLHFDLEGRWQRIFREGLHHRKGLDGRVVALDRPRVDGRMHLERGELDGAGVLELDAWAAALVSGLRDELRSGRLEPVPPPEGSRRIEVTEAADWLDVAAGWTAGRWSEQTRMAHDTGHPWPVLPPACEGLLVLQATVGERWPGSAGPSVRPPEALRIRSQTAFGDHAAAMRRLMGRRLAQYRGLYLSGPDALEQAPDVVRDWLESAQAVFPLARDTPPSRRSDWPIDAVYLAGIEAGVRDPGRLPVDPEVWRMYRGLGLVRLHGLEPMEEPSEGDGGAAALAAVRAAGIAIVGGKPSAVSRRRR